MTRQRPAMVILALVASVCVFTVTTQAQSKQAAASSKQVPAEYQAGISQLRIAKGYLEKAGDKWCGKRAAAIRYIDRAFKALGVSPESTPTEMNSGNVDEPGMLNKGIASLQSAKADLEKAGSGWGGKKVNGINDIDQALQELQTGINCAKQQKTY